MDKVICPFMSYNYQTLEFVNCVADRCALWNGAGCSFAKKVEKVVMPKPDSGVCIGTAKERQETAKKGLLKKKGK